MSMVVIARGRAREGSEGAMEAALIENQALSLAEPGCLGYTLQRGADDPRLFMSVERFESRAAIDSHMQSPHVQKLFGMLGELVAEPPEIVILEEIG